jgi:8-hydroxy-5-deazaflavin:NADPH oxidoreductase
MKIAVLGTGVVGQVVAEKLAELGHEVTIGTRNVNNVLAVKGPDRFGRASFSDWFKDHPKVKLATFAEAAQTGELIVNATNGMASLSALELAGADNMKDKILLDISNPLDFSKGMPPTLSVCNTDSLGEQIQRTYPHTKVVKSLNTLNAYVQVNPAIVPGDHTIFISGNDANAKSKVRSLLNSFGWKNDNILDLGDITTSRGVEQLSPLWVRLLGVFQSGNFNIHVVKAK